MTPDVGGDGGVPSGSADTPTMCRSQWGSPRAASVQKWAKSSGRDEPRQRPADSGTGQCTQRLKAPPIPST